MSTTAAPEQKKPQVRAVSPRRRALRPYLLVLPSLLLTIGILYPFGLGACSHVLQLRRRDSKSGLRRAPELRRDLHELRVLAKRLGDSSVRRQYHRRRDLLGVGVALLLSAVPCRAASLRGS